MSLFLKIFLWFWGAMAILALSLLAVQFATREETTFVPRQMEVRETLGRYAYGAMQAYDVGGDTQLRIYLNQIEKRHRVRVHLFDSRGVERGLGPNDRPASKEVQNLAKVSARKEQIIVNVTFSRIDVTAPIASNRGTFVFVGSTSRDYLDRTRPTAETNWFSLLAFAVVTGLFCYGLARYLAAPVGRIRRAAQRIAAGDLSARVERNRVPRGHDEIAELARDFDTMADRLEGLVTAQNRLLGDVSHELRSPLARLGLALELARRGDGEKQRMALARIEREAERLDELIGELLTLSRLEAGLSERQLSHDVDVARLAAAVAADAAFEAQDFAGAPEAAKTVVYDGPTSGVSVRGDEELLRRALENVTRNALRHTSEGTTVRLGLATDKNQVRVGVADNGPGVPEADIEAIFRPFFRVEDARERTKNDRGTGLGLSIAQRAVQAHGGTINAKNQPEGGLLVEIMLPMHKTDERRAENGTAKRALT